MRRYGRMLWVSIAIWTVGAIPLALAAAQYILTVASGVDDFQAPGSITKRLHAGDERAILVHSFGGSGRFDAAAVSPSDLDCRATPQGPGAPVRAHGIGVYTQTLGRDGYVAKLAFKAPRTDTYVVRCDPAAAALGTVPLGLGKRLHIGRMLAELFGSLAFCAATIMAGVLIARRARKAGPPGRQGPPPAQAPPPPPPPAPPPPAAPPGTGWAPPVPPTRP